MTDTLITAGAFIILAIAVHTMTRYEARKTLLPNSRSQALKDLLNKSNYTASHTYLLVDKPKKEGE